ncbi:MAG: 2-C-methyl-D-erythritol 4-phosphate cytidylyltransferase [Candidatus Zixiibacteriota bacterium]|nr:MAG: 2-C-methyl-D-erythritol 4-phosphate cytidylyltransferase [candidate division Zixibacteria bacterium]HHI03608.1 2-C-methyl-D-erythritol 4-phosphate cytidylyltransferase [candidate division Zixibacteria bacterium]
MNTVALIVAGGKGVRFGGLVPKQFRMIGDKPLLSWTISQFEKAGKIDEIMLVVPEEYLLYADETIVEPYQFRKLSKIIVGGKTRQESVIYGLKSIPISTSFVAIHDGARPIVCPDDINKVVETAQCEQAAILARPIADTVKRVEGNYIISTLDRKKLFQAETPQVFQYDLIFTAHQEFSSKSATDDAYLVELRGFKVRTVIPDNPNIKVTTEKDLEIVKYLLRENNGSPN